MSESKQAKFPVSHTLFPFKDVCLFINLESKPSISPVLIFILSMSGNEREKPGDSQSETKDQPQQEI